MRLPSNFLVRLKDIARRRSLGFGHGTSLIVVQWFLILLFTFFAVLAVAGYAVYRFNYWSSIEEKVAREEVGTAEYDEKSIERILKEFKNKEEATKALMGESLPQASVPAETREQPSGSSDVSPALGE